MPRGYRRIVATLAGLKRRPSLGVIPAFSLALAIYYAFADAGYVPYAQVCTKGDYGPPDQCTYYDIVSAFVGRAFVFLDQHNGMVAAAAGLAVAGFTYSLWVSTEKLWAASEKAAEDNRTSGQIQADKMEKSIDAMLEANKLASHSQRAWIALKCKITKIEADHGLFYLTAEVSIKNIGQTVAENVRFHGFIGQSTSKSFDDGRTYFLGNMGLGMVRSSVILPGERRQFTAKGCFSTLGWESKTADDRMELSLHFYCHYCLVGDGATTHITEGSWELRVAGEDIFDCRGMPYDTGMQAGEVHLLGGLVTAT